MTQKKEVDEKIYGYSDGTEASLGYACSARVAGHLFVHFIKEMRRASMKSATMIQIIGYVLSKELFLEKSSERFYSWC